MLPPYEEFLTHYQAKEWPTVARLGEQLLAASFVEPQLADRGTVPAYMASAYRHLDNLSRAQELAYMARKLSVDGSRTAAYVLVEGMTIHTLRGAFSEALAWGSEFIQIASQTPTEENTRWLGVVHHNLAYVQRMLRNDQAGVDHCRTSADAYQRCGDISMQRYLLVFQAQILCDRGNLADAEALLGPLQESDLPPQHVVDLLSVQATLAYLKGDLPTALLLGSRVLARTLSYPSTKFLDAMIKALIGHTLKRLGHPVEGELYIQSAIQKCTRNGRLDLLAQIARLGSEPPC